MPQTRTLKKNESLLPTDKDTNEEERTESGTSDDAAAWTIVQEKLSSLVGKLTFKRWFSASELQKVDEKWVLFVPNETNQLWIETNYLHELQTALEPVSEGSEAVDVRIDLLPSEELFEVEESKAPVKLQGEIPQVPPPISEQLEGVVKSARLNPVNTFERFVVGGSNEFAHAACLAISKGKGQAYNPLFIHSDSGMGKTHLTQALGCELLKRSPKSKVLYLTCERFTNEFIEAVQRGGLEKFRRKYRKAEVLIVDDVQFLSGKEKSGDEFFHTFNALLDSQAQIVLTSDRPACEIQKLEPRLVSRFESGLTVALQPPSLEMRAAILQKKMEEWDVDLPQYVVNYIAERVKSNIRRLEGALVRVATYCSLGKGELNPEKVESLLHDIIREEMSRKATIDSIQRMVADFYDLRVADMTGRRRPKNIAHARQMAMFLCRRLTRNSLVEIGEAFGGRDHGTVIHACKKFKDLVQYEEDVKQAVDLLETRLTR